MDPDEALIRAIHRMDDPDTEPERIESDSDASSVHEEVEVLDPDMQRLQDDMALRQHLRIGSAFTGPKGVVADRKFHAQQEKARNAEKESQFIDKLSNAALSSGWMARQIKAESSSTLREQEDFLVEYRKKRLRQLQGLDGCEFGNVQELDADSFVSVIDDADEETTVVVFLHHSSIEACRLTHIFITRLASLYTRVKFTKIISTEADASFDSIALPAILVYRGGDLQHTLLRLTDEIPGWSSTGRCEFKDFESYLLIQGVLKDHESSEYVSNKKFMHMSESGFDSRSIDLEDEY